MRKIDLRFSYDYSFAKRPHFSICVKMIIWKPQPIIITGVYAGFRLACRFAAMLCDHRLLLQSYSSQRQRRFGFITERHRSRVE